MTKKEYETTQQRLVKGETMILEAGGFFKAPEKWVRGFQILAEQSLLHEIEHDLLPI